MENPMFTQHPLLSIIVLWVGFICLTLWLLWKWKRTTPSHGAIIEAEHEPDPIWSLAAMMKQRVVNRVDMRPRFLTRTHDPVRSAHMAAQILADQAIAGEEPGTAAYRPAPGEAGYREPVRNIPVTVGPYTVHMRRGSPTYVIESDLGGLDIPAYVIPAEWGEIVNALAFEIVRLREGWSVHDRA